MSKSKILAKVAKKRGWKIINIKLAKMKPEDYWGLSFYPPEPLLFWDELPVSGDWTPLWFWAV
jgi:hypothetical protein